MQPKDVGGQSGYVNFAALLKPGIGNSEDDNPTIRWRDVGKKGDLRVELHYGDFKTGHGRQAALCLYKQDKPQAQYFVPLSEMWMYDHGESLAIMAPEIAKRLYGFVTKDDCYRVLDAVLDYLDDLRKSPPEPEFLKCSTLNAFLQSCDDEGLEFFAEKNGKRII
ncbi:hypothetical protein [Dyella sp.]|jgi:hypothetical protein|uniref:hypothetical protein n=1 Tax=Dyella sp. TaxID=1869338 RepID=UPI002FDB38EF